MHIIKQIAFRIFRKDVLKETLRLNKLRNIYLYRANIPLNFVS